MPRVPSNDHPGHTNGSILFLTVLALSNLALLVVTLVQGLQWAVWLKPLGMWLVWLVPIVLALVYFFYDWFARYFLGDKEWGAYEPTISNWSYGWSYKTTVFITHLAILGGFVAYAARNGNGYEVAEVCAADPTCTEMRRWLLLNLAAAGVSLLSLFMAWGAYTLYVSEESRRYQDYRKGKLESPYPPVQAAAAATAAAVGRRAPGGARLRQVA